MLSWRIRNIVQKITQGFNDIELMDLDYEIAKFACPRLKSYRRLVEDSPSYPPEFNNVTEWLDVIDHIIYFLEQKVIDPDFEDVDMYRYEKGKELLGIYFDNLWH